MSINFPTNTIVLIIAMMIATGAGVWFILAQVFRRLPLSQQARRTWLCGVALFLMAWLLALLTFAIASPAGAVLGVEFLIGLLGLGLLAGVLPLLVSPRFRQALRAIPESWPISIHTLRVAGFLFLALLDMKLLPAEFALPAGYGDMIVGSLALGMLYLLAKRSPHARALGIGWNGLGLLDFVVALITGGMYIQPFSTQLAASEVSLVYLNYVLIVPAFGVPLYTGLHIYSLFQLSHARLGEIKVTPEESVRRHVLHR